MLSSIKKMHYQSPSGLAISGSFRLDCILNQAVRFGRVGFVRRMPFGKACISSVFVTARFFVPETGSVESRSLRPDLARGADVGGTTFSERQGKRADTKGRNRLTRAMVLGRIERVGRNGGGTNHPFHCDMRSVSSVISRRSRNHGERIISDLMPR